MNGNKFFIEIEIFYQNILNDMPNLPEHDTIPLKIILRHTSGKHSQLKVPYKYCTAIDNLR